MPTRLFPLSRYVCAALFSFALLGTTPPAGASGTTLPDTLRTTIDRLIDQPRFARAAWGIDVVSLDSGRTLYAHRPDRLLQSASTAKLYTAALALSTLGPNYQMPTRLLATGPIRNGQLRGSLVLYGMGDPALGSAKDHPDWADRLAAQLAMRGVRRISGDLIADDAYFAGPVIGSGWEAGDLLSSFAAPASALSVQENTLQISVMPAARTGEAARVTVDPVEGFSQVRNRLTTSSARVATDINFYRAPGTRTLHAFGSIAAHATTREFKLATPDPAATAGQLLRQALARQHIAIDGSLRVLHWPEPDTALVAQATTVAELLSPPVSALLHEGLKRSQNLYLQNLLLTAGVVARSRAEQAGTGPFGFITTEAWGERALRSVLDRIGIAASDVQMQEGTGLSRHDLTTPAALTRLLAFLAGQPYAATLRDALPLAGVDGTLTYRMRSSAAQGRVQAKTGSMTFVDCLAGYVTTAGGQRLAFAIMLNNAVRAADAPSPNRTIDAIVTALAQDRSAAQAPP